MSIISRLWSRQDPRSAVRPLYAAVVARGRDPAWYLEGKVPDTMDGRFEMISAVLCLVLMRLEKADDMRDETVLLTETFVEDMDGQLRQSGVGDVVVGKQIGKMMSALGGRLGAYRTAFETGGEALAEALRRNLYGGTVDADALHWTAGQLAALHRAIQAMPATDLLSGTLPDGAPGT